MTRCERARATTTRLVCGYAKGDRVWLSTDKEVAGTVLRVFQRHGAWHITVQWDLWPASRYTYLAAIALRFYPPQEAPHGKA